ncbi:MAG TPA: glycosyltransferase family 4 protein [Thermoanaerobaculia bacterium]|jgi:glycosyltransferase involved in cell wall biosynthesis|nr:glycosyltransferase family 4 protein [Thermoanaerobaculia bacterium]
MPLKILHLAAGNRWTGAAAPAFAEVEALRAAGVDAHYAYVGGYKLEAKLRHHDFAHPLIGKAQNPVSFLRTVQTLRRLIDHHGFDVVHAHLTYDHWLARFAVSGTATRLGRTFHARRVLRSDPFTLSLLHRTEHLFVINRGFHIEGRQVVFTPPPLDRRQFHPDGPDVRAAYGIGNEEKLLVAIGKLAKGRGFELALDTLAEVPEARLMIIGHGEHRSALEAHAARHGVEKRVIWAGYHEDDLAEHYRAADALLFTARGSDEGHRAVLEAMACGVMPVVAPLEGIDALVPADSIARAHSAAALAETARRALHSRSVDARRHITEHTLQFSYEAAAERLIAAYSL